MSEVWDVIVIGAGPAGVAAAIQLHRCDLDVLVLEARRVGGLLHEANLIENYPGTGGAIRGSALADRLEAQMRAVGAPVHFERVARLERVNTEAGDKTEPFVWDAVTETGRYRAKSVIAASGTVPRRGGLTGVSVSPEAASRVIDEISPIFQEQERHIGIIGAGDAAFDYALNLAERGNSVVIFNRSEQPPALKLLVRRAEACELIEYRACVKIPEVQATADYLRVTMERNSPRRIEQECFHYLVSAIGRQPAVEYLPEGWEILAASPAETGLYCVGDMVNKQHRQMAIASGAGLEAAMAVYERHTGFVS